MYGDGASGKAVDGVSDSDFVALVYLQAGGVGVPVALNAVDGDGDRAGLGVGRGRGGEGEDGEEYAANYSPKSGGGG